MDVFPIVVDWRIKFGVDWGWAFSPTGRAYFSIFSMELESLQQSQVVRHISTHPKIVNANMPQNLMVIYKESASQGQPTII